MFYFYLFRPIYLVREGLLVPLIGLPEQVSGNLDHGFTDLILVDTACVEAELYNLHFCSFISVGQRTNEVSLSTMSLLFISSWKKYCGIWLADQAKEFLTGLPFTMASYLNPPNKVRRRCDGFVSRRLFTFENVDFAKLAHTPKTPSLSV